LVHRRGLTPFLFLNFVAHYMPYYALLVATTYGSHISLLQGNQPNYTVSQKVEFTTDVTKLTEITN